MAELRKLLRRGSLVLLLLFLTVPWNAQSLLSHPLGPLPLWVWYSLASCLLLSISTCILANRWWPTNPPADSTPTKDVPDN